MNKIIDSTIERLIQYALKEDSKGSGCSVSGTEYEYKVHNVVKRCVTPNGEPFNNQKNNDLGGSSGSPDIICTWDGNPICIECKHNAVDWGQSKVDLENGKWKHKDAHITEILNQNEKI